MSWDRGTMLAARVDVVALAALALCLGACGGSGDEGASGDAESSDGVTESTLDDGSGQDGSPDDGGDDATEQSDTDGSSGSGTATVTVNGTTYEFEVTECQIGSETDPDDLELRAVADNGDDVSVVYFAQESLQGLNGLDMETTEEGGGWTWASSYVGADSELTYDVGDEGVTGTAEIGVVGIDAPSGETLVADYSFAC